jgi:long-chain acyl-CoA synthetase
VAAVIVPAKDVPASEAESLIEKHMHEVSAKLPLYKRVKTFEIREEELPRTATRKVKKREIVAWLQEKRLLEAKETGSSAEASDKEWLLDLVARVSEKPRSAVTLDSGLDELGYDSLMYNELAGAIESATGESLTAEALMSTTAIREIAENLKRRPHREVRESRAPREADGEKVELPDVVKQAGRASLSLVQKWFYHDVLRPEFRGRANIPAHAHFLAVANHASHLDMGLVKMALGESGRNLVALAAADYFFDNKVKRTFFENFTNLVPMERKGSLRRSLEWAFHLLEQGYNVLIFPEGTRSRTGEIQPFQRGLGHLVLRARVGVLPLYLETYGALPPGAWYPQSREVTAAIGPYLPYEVLSRAASGLPRSDAERVVTTLVQRVVECLRDGVSVDVQGLIEAERGRFADRLQKSAEKPATVGKKS